MAAKKENKRVAISATPEIMNYLEDLASIGIHGKTPTEVAKTLLSNEIERLIREDIIQLKK